MSSRLVPATQGEAYAIRRQDGLIKLGFSTDMRNRLPSIKYTIKMEVEHVYSIIAGALQAKRIEKIAHLLASNKRIEGEWFDLTEDEAVDILSRAANIYIDAGETVIFPDSTRRVPVRRERPRAYRIALPEDLDRRLSAWRGKQPKIPSTRSVVVTLLTFALDQIEKDGLTPATHAGDKVRPAGQTNRVGKSGGGQRRQ